MAGTALRGRLTWQLAEFVEAVAETPRVKTIVFDVPGWPGHRAGQHVDVRLTAEDGHQAERSYSIASAPIGTRVPLTVQRLEDGEVALHRAPLSRQELTRLSRVVGLLERLIAPSPPGVFTFYVQGRGRLLVCVR